MDVNNLKKLRDEMHFTYQLCEHSSKSGICAPLYCMKIHNLQAFGKEVFNSNFPLSIPLGSHEYYYFSALEEARRNCCKNCEMSRFYFRIAVNYIKSLERSV